MDTAAVMACLRPLWAERTETASRVRSRIERVLDWARVHGLRSGDNPARWKGHLDHLLPRPSKVAKPPRRAEGGGAWPDGGNPATNTNPHKTLTGSLAIHFGIQSSAAALWSIPAGRMKGGRPHVVPLSEAAVAILRPLPRDQPPFALTENAMLYLLQRQPPKGLGHPYTVHGFRSSFRDWAAETTDHAGEVVEMALAHAIRNRAEAAYRRGDLLDKRRSLMGDWAGYLAGRL